MKRMKFLSALLLSFALVTNGYAAPRYTLEDGTGAEVGTSANPLKARVTEASMPSTSSGLTIYNTADETTNFEKFRAFWNSNVLELGNYYGGTGVTRAIRVGTTQSAGASILGTYLEIKGNAVPFFNFVRATSNTGIFVTNTGLYGNASSGEQIFWTINPQVQQSSTASYVALEVNPTETSTGSGTKLLQRWAVGGTVKGSIDNTGKHSFDATNTAGGTTGNQTINKPSGTVNFAAAATAITVTNSTVTTSSIVTAIARTNDSTCSVKNVVPGSGSFVINMTAACTAETSVGFIVFN